MAMGTDDSHLWKCVQVSSAVKRRDVKSKGEKERYTHLNAEFQRIARRDKKAFLSDQCKEIEEKIRMGKTRDLLLGKESSSFFLPVGLCYCCWAQGLPLLVS